MKRGKVAWIVLTIMVCVAGTLTTLFFTAFAVLFEYGGYLELIMTDRGMGPTPGMDMVLETGFWLGIILGLGAGVLWTIAMRRISAKQRGFRLALAGTGVGAGVGSLATALLHAGLMIVSGKYEISNLLTIPMYGAPAGAILGFLCGLLAWAASSMERREKQTQS